MRAALASALAVRPSEVLARVRERALEIIARSGGGDVRIFGSIARGTDHPGSDVDLIVRLEPGRDAESWVGGVGVAPDDVAADQACLVAVAVVVGAVEGEAAQTGELGLDPVEPGAVERYVGELDVVRCGPVTDAGVGLG